MQHEATIIEKSNQLLVELRENPDWQLMKKFQTRLFQSVGVDFTRYMNYRKTV